MMNVLVLLKIIVQKTPILQDLDKQDAHGDLIMDIADSIYKDKNGYYVVIVSNKNKIIEKLR